MSKLSLFLVSSYSLLIYIISIDQREVIIINIDDIKKEDLEEKAEMLKVLAHPSRLCILFKLLKVGESNVTNMQHCLSEPQSTVSQHIAKLKSAGIIEGKRNGTEINYRIHNKEIEKLLKVLIS